MRPDGTAPPGDGAVQIGFAATPMAVRGALAEARAAWTAAEVAPGVRDAAELVVAEVLNNVVEHAQAGRPDGVVTLATWPAEGGLCCEVRDDGRPMPDNTLPEGVLADITGAVEDLPEGGFGWFMIRSLTRDLAYAREGTWNRLSFCIPEGAGET